MRRERARRDVALRVLILGGTVFLGRHVVEALLARGHDVTLFHRGQRGRELFPAVERVLGDRATDLDRLPAGARWDAVVDTSAYVPAVAATSAAALRDRVRHYVFVSSVSVYDIAVPRIDESSATPELPADASRDVMVPETYGPLKLLCEREVTAVFGPQRTFIVRPGLIVGPWDPTDRFTYWPLRFARGGDVLVPDDLDAQAPIVDVRDLAAFIADAIEAGRSGIVNTANTPDMTLRAMFNACAAASDVPSLLVPVAIETLRDLGIEEWSDLPAWVVPNAGHDGMRNVDPSRALAMGLHHRPLIDTARDTLHWAQTHRGTEPLKAGLTPEREATALAQAIHT
ncbi:MAG TPA: NAD-dependent epimerase/dehydratase family protein [Candidatus Elarobacter sp.]|nr:NAD-dependent epimerase/dehydratase family protein [Candidatus Elarobacter sp.]